MFPFPTNTTVALCQCNMSETVLQGFKVKYQSESVIVGSGCICGYLLFCVSCGHITRESLCLECLACVLHILQLALPMLNAYHC